MNRTLLLTALVSASAFAQETMTPPPSPPPQTPPSATPAPPIRPPDSPMLEEDPGGRIRWGVSGNLGWHIPYPAFTLGAEGRIGYQVSNIFSAYAIVGVTGGFGFGGSANSSGASASITGLSYYYFGAIAEAMFADIFYVGGGPVIASGGLGIAGLSVGNGGAGITAVADSGVMPGFDLRLGLGLGRPHPGPSFRRGGFNLGLNVLMLLHPDTVVTRIQGDSMGGSVSVNTNELVFTATPMVQLGYDWR
jgi:hypothetical protein